MQSLFSRLPRGSSLWAVLLVLVTLIWGNSFIAIKHIVAYVSSLELVALRFAPVALTFGAILLPTRGGRIRSMIREEGWRLAFLGLTGAAPRYWGRSSRRRPDFAPDTWRRSVTH